jgi:hypothetical protein
MRIDQAAAVLRPRRPWEGIDLGFTLARTWFPTLWALWWLGALPPALVLLVLTGGQADWWILFLWWFKPFYEAPLVYWISRALFGERLTLRAARGPLAAAWTPRLLPFLLWRRLGPNRAFNLPIVLLEGLKGGAVRRRRRALSGGDATAAWLTVIAYHFEAILWFGLLFGLYLFIPVGLPDLDLWSVLSDTHSWTYWLSSAIYLLVCSVIAPFYCCAGFALYIGRRTELEAWDLDLAFRQAGGAVPATAGRRRRGGPGVPGRLAAGLLLAALTTAGPAVGAAVREAPLPEAATARALIGEVLSDQTFGGTRETEVWLPIASPAPRADVPGWPRWLSDAAVILGRLFKVVLAAAVVLALALILYRVLSDWQPGSWRRRGRPPSARPGAPGVSGPGPLPVDPAAAARARLALGDARGALALLYRGAIDALVRGGLAIAEGATEGECLRLAGGRLGLAELDAFRALTRDWQALAYAHRAPDPRRIEAHLDRWHAWTDAAAGEGGTVHAA